jgi:RNA polymerase sigma-70 factor (ECF subfamily)
MRCAGGADPYGERKCVGKGVLAVSEPSGDDFAVPHADDAADAAARRVMRGDGNAFAIVVAETSVRLHRLAVRMTGDRDEAEDVLQESYVRAHRALVDGAWDERARVQTWLYRIVVNTALNERRQRLRRLKLVDARGPAEATQEREVEVRQLMALVRELPEEQRAALILKELEGMTAGEIADVLQCSEGAVEQRLVRARATLRARWQRLATRTRGPTIVLGARWRRGARRRRRCNRGRSCWRASARRRGA